ncbi:MAG: GNAT family N-acetyltransferase [Patescibacteria group bacterium]|nr:GNAT family N-acetyltransferase [Patescibacteria group bacterium]
MTRTFSLDPIDVSRWQEYRDLWLEALRETPEAFAADYDTQAKVPDEIWRERLEEVLRETTAVMVFAQVDNQLVGMIGAYYEENPKFSHIATIWGVYVKPEFRKQGIATDLANELIEKIKRNPAIKKIKNYSVTTGQMAVTVYKNHGFEIVGISKEELKTAEGFKDVYIMEKYLR